MRIIFACFYMHRNLNSEIAEFLERTRRSFQQEKTRRYAIERRNYPMNRVHSSVSLSR